MIWTHAFTPSMRGAYCLVIELRADCRLTIGSLGVANFHAGIYVYVGSALSGIEKRVSRHKSTKKKRRWHIDYLLDKAEILSLIAIPSDRKSTECEVLRALTSCEGASVPVKGFGSSDCDCVSHLVWFGNSDPEWIAEVISMRISMLETAYPRKTC